MQSDLQISQSMTD